MRVSWLWATDPDDSHGPEAHTGSGARRPRRRTLEPGSNHHQAPLTQREEPGP